MLQLPMWAAGPATGCFPSPVCHGPFISGDNTNITISLLVLQTSTEKPACLQTPDMEPRDLSRASPLWESPFSEVSNLAHFLTWWLGPWGHHPHKRVLMRWIQAVLSEAVSVALPCLLWLKSSFSSDVRLIYLLTLYFTAGIFSMFLQNLFHSNNQQCEAVT